MNSIISNKDIGNTVTIKNGQEVVRSDKLAKMFEKQHKNILAIIRQKSEFIKGLEYSLKNFFIEEEYKVKSGSYIRYYLTRKGFDFVALSLTGRNADMYKLYYIDAFHDKQRVIEEHKLTAKLNKTDDLWLQFRDEGKVFRTKLTDSIKKHVTKYREDVENKLNDGGYYYHYTTLIYNKLNISLPKGANPRDVLDKRMLVRLEDLEDKVTDMIEALSKDNHYKDVYKLIKDKLITKGA